mgnify:CR=1 FL=1
MTTEELLRQLYDSTLVGNGPEVLELTRAGLAAGLGPETLLYEALIPALEEVGARFERGDFFVPEMLIAGKAMAATAMSRLQTGSRRNANPRASTPQTTTQPSAARWAMLPCAMGWRRPTESMSKHSRFPW